MSDWQPTISLKNLYARAEALAVIREFFSIHDVLEVETPLACAYTVTEPNIESYAIAGQQDRFLQTSPEYAMKRLLAAGSSDIYQICKCFRQGEQGAKHNPEFTMIEWYRKDFSLEQMMQETVALIGAVMNLAGLNKQVEYLAYADLFKEVLGTSYFDLTETDFDALADQHGLQSFESASLAQKIDFIFSHVITKQFNSNTITCVSHYPAEQAALARLKPDDHSVAERFEVFCGDLELANGYVELVDAEQQRRRFDKDQAVRCDHHLPEVKIDPRLLEALKHGLPECAGVALGLDRLLQLVLNASSIEEVMSFSWDNA